MPSLEEKAIVDYDWKTYWNIFLTSECNNRCSYCIVKNELGKGTRLTFHDLREFINEYAKEGDVVEITGGEPTMIPWLTQLIQLLEIRDIYSIVRTNGYMLYNNIFEKHVIVLNTHGKDITWRPYLKPTDTVLGVNQPLEMYDDKNGQIGFSNVKEATPFGHCWHIYHTKAIFDRMCTYKNPVGYLGIGMKELDKNWIHCPSCDHSNIAWYYIKRIYDHEKYNTNHFNNDKKPALLY